MTRHAPGRSPLWKIAGFLVCALLGVLIGLAAPDAPAQDPRHPDTFDTSQPR